MKWTLVAMLVVWTAVSEGFPTDDQRTRLLKAISKVEEKLEEARQMQDYADYEDMPYLDVDILSTVQDTVDQLPESTTLVSNLLPDQIAEAITRVTSAVIENHVHEDCQHVVWMAIFIGSLKHTVETELLKREMPTSFYGVVSRWANTEYPLVSHGLSLNTSDVQDLVNVIFHPFLYWIDNVVEKLDLSGLEDGFFKAISTSIQMTQNSCSRSNTVTLRTVIVQLFKKAKDLKLFSGEDVCPDSETVLTTLKKLLGNIGDLLDLQIVESMLSEILERPEVESLVKYVQNNYDLPYVLQVAFELGSSGYYEEVAGNFSDVSEDIDFVRIIEDLIQDVEPEENLKALIIQQFPDVDVFGLHTKMPKEERGYLLTLFIEHLLRRLHQNCPGVALAEIFLGFVHYATYNMPGRNQFSLMMDEMRLNFEEPVGDYFDYDRVIDQTAIKNDGSLKQPPKDDDDRRENGYVPLANIYDIMNLVQRMYLDRLDQDLKPVLDVIDVRSAEALFWNIENQLITEDPDHVTVYELLQDIENIFLAYRSDTENRICNKETNAFSQLKSLLQTAVPRLLTPIEARDIHSKSLYNVSTILKKLEQVYLPESIVLGLIRVLDVVRSDSLYDVERRLAKEITSVIDEILRVSIDYYNPYEVEEPLEGQPVQLAIDDMFQQRKDEIMKYSLASKNPVDALSDFFIMFIDEARRRGVDTEQYLEILKEVIETIADTTSHI